MLLSLLSLTLLASAGVASAAPPAPVITLTTPVNGAKYTQGSTVLAQFSCTTFTTCKGWQLGVEHPSGTPIVTDTLGSHAFAVLATNTVGGQTTNASKTINYTVVAPTSAPSNQTLPSISGSPIVGQVLTASPGTWGGTTPITYTYAWSDGVAGANRTLKAADAGKTLTVTVTAKNSAGTGTATSASVGPVTSGSPPPPPACVNGYVAITFDDGPSSLSQQYVAALNAGGAHATFFNIAGPSWDDPTGNGHMQQYPNESAAEIAAGNAVGDHTVDHQDFTGQTSGLDPLTTDQAVAEVQGQQNLLAQQAPGYTENLIRPPYGDMNWDQFVTLRGLGWTTVHWTADTNDWQLPSTAKIVSVFLAGATDQAVILQHDGYPNTLAAIPQELAGLKSMGLCSGRIVPNSANAGSVYDIPQNYKITSW